MRVRLLNQLNSLVSGNERLIGIYRSMYYLLPAKEENLSGKILCLLEKREELELELKKCSFFVRNSMEDKECNSNILIRFMPVFLKLEFLARKFKDTRQNSVYLEEKKYLKKYFEFLYTEDLSDKMFELLLKIKRRHNSVN